MTIDEGYIKFEIDWADGPAPDAAAVELLEAWRRPLFDAGLIGHYEDLGIGFGNISVRTGAAVSQMIRRLSSTRREEMQRVCDTLRLLLVKGCPQ